MKRSSGVRVAATVAVSALSLALVTGCGGGSDDSKGSDGQAAKALSAAELKKVIIAKGDVAGYEVDASGKQLPKSKDQIKSSDEQCTPLAYAMGGMPPSDSASNAAVMVRQEKKPSDTASKSLEDLSEGDIEKSLTAAMSLDMVVVGLSSYDGEGAQETFKSVSDAVKNCSGGFTLTMQGEDQKITKLSTEKASGAGDESVAFAAVSDMEDGDVGTTHIEVVRHGSTIATYYTINIGLMMTDKAYDVPAAVIDAQAAKLK
ncbi:hypothetical protein J7F01_23285 [Streptomyces sp. ISL-22]|uniref:hypothetical protein n=1 Tax=Streptomyces TaxID=1883 RepID=UPI001ABFE6E5|nr:MULTISPECIES: hypothetical protein [Streptomyces]MBT2421579.1 hypothetical protein [Streptomyces sp. ISL-24]MBT2435041.1 hypothetical protein [Streptomyces sp. ISL-22]